VAETYKWLFIGEIPVLYQQKKVARQLGVEMWLNPAPLLKSLKLIHLGKAERKKAKYIV
jgi:hypothetical protein